MSSAGKTLFRGFSPKTIEFLGGLRAHSTKAWFVDHRDAYEGHLLEPMKDLVADLGPTMRAIDDDLETRPVVGKTISRIYRDTRFSRDISHRATVSSDR